MSESDTDTDCTEQCHRCEERPADIYPESSDPPLCQQCVTEIMRESAREGERGQGQRPIGQQRAVDRTLSTDTEQSTTQDKE